MIDKHLLILVALLPPITPFSKGPTPTRAHHEQLREATTQTAGKDTQLTRSLQRAAPIAEPKQWRTQQRWIGRRENYAPTARAIAGLVSGRCAIR
ncbi:MAG: hypothetical protein JWN52_2664 [Actinomycetia bacterium]|nr:hypothetical protein [Actinomycetes bacterium]